MKMGISVLVLWLSVSTVFGGKPKTAGEICSDCGLSAAELAQAGLYEKIGDYVIGLQHLKEEYQSWCKHHGSSSNWGPFEGERARYNRRISDYWDDNYDRFLRDLTKDYQKYLQQKQAEETKRRQATERLERERAETEKKRLAEEQKRLAEERQHAEVEQKRLAETQKRFDELQKQLEVVQGQNREIMAFLTIMDQKISSVQDVVQRLDMARQVLSRPNLSIDELNLVNRRLKSLNEDIKVSKDINDEERVQLSDDIRTLNALIKEKVVASLALE